MAEVSKEVALDEFERLAKASDIDVDTSDMNEEAAKATEEMSAALIKAIKNGRLAVDEEGRAVLVTTDGTSMTFRKPLGRDLVLVASSTNVEDINRFISSLTGQDTKTVLDLIGKDYMLAVRLAGFLQAV